MNHIVRYIAQHKGMLAGLLAMLVMSLALAVPTNAAPLQGSITASFNPSTGVLTVKGDDQSNTIVISHDAGGTILVNSGTIPIVGGAAKLTNTQVIEVFGLGKNDLLALDETNGQLPKARMWGGAGNDTLTGGTGNDQLLGEADNDVLLGMGGADAVSGGVGNDTLTGGAGSDQLLGEAGNDQILWNPGDEGDVIEGGVGNDTVAVTGSDDAEAFSIAGDGAQLRLERTSPNRLMLDIRSAETLALTTNGGNDTVAIGSNVAPLAKLILDGGNGTDAIAINSANEAEIFTAVADNHRVRFERTVPAPFLLDIGAAETLALTTNGGDDRVAMGVGVDKVIKVTTNGSPIAAGEAIVEGDSTSTRLSSAGISASFSPSSATLTIFGNVQANTITVSRDSAGTILVNGGAVRVQGGTPTVANTTLIQVYGQAGSDLLSLDEASGPLPKANIFGSTENDTLTGGSEADLLFGQAGNDSLLGKSGNDLLFGGADNDLLTGGDGDDQVYGESGSDRLVWHAGDDSDLHEGGDGSDTVAANGGNDAEGFTTTANGTRVRFDQLSPAASFLDIGTVESLTINANGGNDTVSATGNLAALIQIAVDGGAGNDTLLGSNGLDVLIGGDGNDFIDGNQGNDTLSGSAGDDTFQWDPGDGNETVEGQSGADRLLFNGSGANEIFDASANGTRLRFNRTVAGIVIDANEIETVDLNALGGTDLLTVNDLSGTGVAKFNVNLAGTFGGTSGDAQPDQIIVKGTNNKDIVEIGGSSASLAVSGLPTLVTASHADGANDSVVVETLADHDTLLFNGSGGNEKIDIAANADRVWFYRGQAGMTIELNDIETINANALGGADTISVGDLSGTDLQTVNLNLASAGDTQPDTVTVNGTNGDDVIGISGSASSGVAVAGLAATVNIKTLAGIADTLTVNALSGSDAVNASGLGAGVITLAANGSLGNDIITGSQGTDLITGGDGNDQVIMSAGDDTFVWSPGDDNDTVEGQDGADTLLFNGSSAAEKIDIAANGERVRFFRDIAAVTMDLNDLEAVTFNAGLGADLIFVNDLSGTDLSEVNLNLAAFGGGGDGQIDNVFVNGTNGNDAIVPGGDTNGTAVLGLAAQVNITGAEVGDGLLIAGFAGDDTVDGSSLASGAMQLTAYGGDHDDVLIGGDNVDVLYGEDGDDTLLGGPGVDMLDGGAGNNTILQD